MPEYSDLASEMAREPERRGKGYFRPIFQEEFMAPEQFAVSPE
jgi:hypothetical protein